MEVTMRTYQIGAGIVSLLVVMLDLVVDWRWLAFKVGETNATVYPTVVLAFAGVLLIASASRRLSAV